MRIAIATSGRFHVLDLARELTALGHEVAFYSFVPRRRALRFGLPAKCHRGLLPAIAPWLVLQRLAPPRQRESWDRRVFERLDGLIERRLEHCDVFIGMSGLCVESARVAREKYGARIFIERGSRHVMSQKQILEDLAALAPATGRVPAYAVARELASYALADSVVVPAQHVVESFLERGFPRERLFRNPYGVDLSMFRPTPPPPMDRPVVLHVGAWSMRKGCDYLLTAVKRCGRNATLRHVGAIGDAAMPEDSSFDHHDPVPQWRLQEFYAKAHILVLASREEGLSLVQAQALACGLPVVCTDRTGGRDLKAWLGEPKAITVVKAEDVEGLSKALAETIDWQRACLRPGVLRDLLRSGREQFSWRTYGERYHSMLRA